MEPREAWERVRLLGGPRWRAWMWARALGHALIVGFVWGSVVTLGLGLLSGALPPAFWGHGPYAAMNAPLGYAVVVVFGAVIVLMVSGPLTDGPLALADEKTVSE